MNNNLTIFSSECNENEETLYLTDFKEYFFVSITFRAKIVIIVAKNCSTTPFDYIMNNPINLKTLSEILQLSQTTVSRALNGYPEVGEKTRQRVTEAAKQYNYQPSSAASKLAKGKTHTIGHVMPIQSDTFFNPYFSDFIAGAGLIYAKNEYEILLHASATPDEETVYRDLAQSRRVDGVVVHGPLMNDERITLLTKIGLPFVVHGRSDNADIDYSWLDVDNFEAIYRATEFLIHLGHRRIAFINGPETMNFAFSRRQGFEDAMNSHGLSIDNTLLSSGEMTESRGYTFTQTILNQTEPPTAIVTSGILMAMGAQRAISDANKLLKYDVSIITYDDCLSFLNPSNRDGVPLFTCVRSSILEAGKKVAEMLLAQIEHKTQTKMHELWKTELVVGDSTGICLKK